MQSNIDTTIKKVVVDKKEEVWHNKIKSVQPVIIDVKHDRTAMKKTTTYQITKHIYKDNKETKSKDYDRTIITKEVEVLPLNDKDINNSVKSKLLNSIANEVSKVDLTTIKSKEDILNFACSEPVSNTEKMRRAVALCKVVNQKLEDKWSEEKKRRLTLDKKEQNKLNKERNAAQRCKITKYDIAYR